MLLLRVQSFNTSHVTLYPVPEMIYLPRDSFNTSYVTLYQVWAILWFLWHFGFQYISCYSLSINSKMTVYLIARFNTSHVTLYQYKACKLHIRPERFNTSHVTLYLEGEIIEEKPLTFQYISCYSLSISCPICFFRTVVSIHLMLLFIRTPA